MAKKSMIMREAKRTKLVARQLKAQGTESDRSQHS